MATYTNSSLVTQTKLLTNGHYNPRTGPIEGITIHHNAGVCSVKSLLDYAYNTTREMSFNYCVNDDDIGLSVEEKYRAWTSGNRANDYRCVTIEVCNSSNGGNWPISDKSMNTLIKLCADICTRNGIKKLYFDGTTTATLTRHNMFQDTNCPGPYIEQHTQYICDEVNKLIGTDVVDPTPVPTPNMYEVVVKLKGYYTAADAIAGKNPVRDVEPGNYYVYNETSEAVNVTKDATSPGAWINKSLNKIEEEKEETDNPIGKDVILNGQLFGNSAGGNPGGIVINLKTKITRYIKGAAKPYNTTGDLGWVAEESVTFIKEETAPSEPVKPSEPEEVPSTTENPIGKDVIVNGRLYGTSSGENPGSTVKNLKTKVTRYIQGAAKPYNFTGDVGWASSDSVTFVKSNNTKEDSELVFHVGDIVKIKKGAKSYTGVTMASFVYENNYRIDELDGDRAVLDKSGICTDFKTSDLEKV